jgi:DNA-binding SARP family transcriptional activator
MPPRLVTIVASAGYGKSTLARAYARAVSSRRAIADAAVVNSDDEFVEMLLQALSESRPALRTRIAAVRSQDERHALLEVEWQGRSGPSVITIDNAQGLDAVPDSLALLRRLLQASTTRRVVLCSRRNLLEGTGEVLNPHETVRLRAGELQFDESEIASVLTGLKIRKDHIEAIASLTWGWAAAVLFLRRCAAEGVLPAVIEDLASPLWAPFHEYVQRSVVEALSPQARALLFAAVAVPALRRRDLEAVYGRQAVATGLRDLIDDLAMLRGRSGNEYTVHPLIHAAVVSRYRDDVSAATHAFASAYSTSDPLHAALLYARMNEPQAASAAYRDASLVHLDSTSYTSSLEAAALGRETLINHLPLFNAATVSDYYRLDVNDWLAQAEEALRLAPTDTPLKVRRQTLVNMAIRYALAGRFADGHKQIEHECRSHPGDERDALLCELLHAILDANSDALTSISDLRRRLAPLLTGKYMRGLFARRIVVPVAALWGDWARCQQELELAFTQAQERERSPFVAEIAITACFEAWRHMDAHALQRWRARLQEFNQPSLRGGTALFIEALDGGSIGSEQFETPETRVRAYLIAAALEDDQRNALALAKRALRAAEARKRPLFIVLARVALASIEPSNAEHMRVARKYASETPSTPLREAVEAIASNSTDHGMLSGFTQRFTRSRIPLRPQLRIDILSGEVRWNDTPVKMEQRPMQLLLFFALKGVPLRAEEIVASLWPERSTKAMANALRVHVSALRTALSKDAVRYENERYSLACSAVLDLQFIESRLRRSRRRASLNGSDRRLFVNTLRQLDTYNAGDADLAWVAALESRVNDLHFEVALSLARDALVAWEYENALRYAQRAANLHPWNERACEIALRALLQQGKRTDAVRRYRLFADELARSLGIEPSPALSQLVFAP